MRSHELAAKLTRSKVRHRGGHFDCLCPSHEDHEPSCTFSDGESGIVFTCHAGCASKDVATAMAKLVGCAVKEFFFRSNGYGEPLATYTYSNVDGTINRQVLRGANGGFPQRRPDPSVPGKWLYDVAGIPKVLYRLRELQGAPIVDYLEGEKDVETFRALGFVATTHPMGAKAFHPDYARQLVQAMAPGGLVRVFRDEDPPGIAVQGQILRACHAAGLRVKCVVLPALPPIPGADVTDWLQMGHTLDELRALLEATPEWTPATQPAPAAPDTDHAEQEPAAAMPRSRPIINVSQLGLDAMATAAWDALEGANVPPVVYGYGNGLAWITEDPRAQLEIERLGDAHIKHRLADVATFERDAKGSVKPAVPPQVLAVDMVTVPRRTLPRLYRLVHVPVFLAEGRLLTTPGFDAASGVYYAPTKGLEIPAIPEAPTPADVDAALALLCEDLLEGFPFISASDVAHALALLFTPFLRDLILGNTPLWIIKKPAPRTGASLLVKVFGRIQSGTPVAPATLASGRDGEEENRKRLSSFLLSAPPLLLLDNLSGRVDSMALASALTCWPEWKDRLLGKTQQLVLPMTTCLVATGNNAVFSTELTGRGVLIALDAETEHPETRENFKHRHLDQWVTAERGRLLGAALTCCQSWIAAGMPARTEGAAFGGFEEWTAVLGGLLDVIGVGGFLANRGELYATADEETATLKAFLTDWRGRYGAADVVTKELMELAQAHPLNIASKTTHGMLIRLSNLITGIVDRRFTLPAGGSGGSDAVSVVVRRRHGHGGALVWRLEDGGSGGSGGSVSTHVSHVRARVRV